MTHFGVAIALVATTIYNVGFVLEKRALTYLPAIDAHRIWSLLRTLFTAPGWLAGFALILFGMVLQLVVLSLEPLTVAQPLQASGVVVTILLSRLVLRERLGRTEIACITVLVISVVLLSLSSGHGSDAGTHADGLSVALAALPGILLGLVIYLSAQRAARARHRFRRGVSGVSYGLCAGLMYGVAGLALKALSAGLFSGGLRRSGTVRDEADRIRRGACGRCSRPRADPCRGRTSRCARGRCRSCCRPGSPWRCAPAPRSRMRARAAAPRACRAAPAARRARCPWR